MFSSRDKRSEYVTRLKPLIVFPLFFSRQIQPCDGCLDEVGEVSSTGGGPVDDVRGPARLCVRHHDASLDDAPAHKV